jgi:hypothetical protein
MEDRSKKPLPLPLSVLFAMPFGGKTMVLHHFLFYFFNMVLHNLFSYD